MLAKITIQAESPKAGQGFVHVCCMTEQSHHQSDRSRQVQIGCVKAERDDTKVPLPHRARRLALTCQTYCMDLPPVTQ